MSGNQHILVASNEESEFKAIASDLLQDDYKVIHFKQAENLLLKAQKYQPQLIVLDMVLADMDGIEALISLRNNPFLSRCWIVFLSDRSEDYSKVAGLEAGADDYIVKPISSRLLLAKVKAILKRRKVTFEINDTALRSKGVTLDYDKYTVTVHNRSIQLLRKEFDLLRILLESPGKVYNRDEIKSLLWKANKQVKDRSIDVHISNIRRKIGKSFIRTIKGVGYKFSA